ncbi:permease [Halobacillus locisalis]|uniref:Permease n=2 Tax=Halobacillus locisalis TaxID=220753 RepID=A0A838CQ62_9BACI|nr:permease [Halobacillus locisalis]
MFKVMGAILSIQFLFVLIVSLLAGDRISFFSLPLLSTAVIAFSMSYLHPQFRQKDERMRLIRYKGLFFSFFAILGYMFIMMTLLQFNMIDINAIEVLQILSALFISTVFLSWVFVAKRN